MPDLSPYADEDTLTTNLLLAMLGQVTERAAGSAAVYLEPLNRYEATYLNTVRKAADLCRAADHPRIQLMADLFHMNIEEAVIPASLRAVAPHLGHVHLADSQRWLPGHGHTDFVSAFRALRGMSLTAGWRWSACRRRAIRCRICATASSISGLLGAGGSGLINIYRQTRDKAAAHANTSRLLAFSSPLPSWERGPGGEGEPPAA